MLKLSRSCKELASSETMLMLRLFDRPGVEVPSPRAQKCFRGSELLHPRPFSILDTSGLYNTVS